MNTSIYGINQTVELWFLSAIWNVSLLSNNYPVVLYAAYATVTVVVPATVIDITPSQVQLHLDVLLRAGDFRNVTVGDPGVQGVVTGIQGVGVSTPLAAAVADAVVGFESDEHTPNGGILVIGIESSILAAGFLSPVTVGTATINVDGAAPKLHDILAVAATNCAIVN